MRLGMVGLGRMGANMTLRLVRGGHEVVAYDVRPDAVRLAVEGGAIAASSLGAVVEQLPTPRAVWVMVPAGEITETTIADLGELLSPGDLVVDGGNSRFRDSQRRSRSLAEHGVGLVDAGTSGGIWGLQEGFCLMIGGSIEDFDRLEPIFATLAPSGGYARVGAVGAGHFTKMVHNGIEYALMEAYGEGFDLLQASRFDIDVAAVAELWRHGSVVRSWLLDLAARALRSDPELGGMTGYVEDSGEGRWAVEEALDQAIPAPAIALALFQRFGSRRDDAYANRLIAALRREFGGHGVHEPEA
ncbi:MAG: decarboxylating 6-phosphogluconate dehydrogenase [Actinobacteria bacterium]|nr:decarboxylating 6-phosphogluconate dehydrogenase [Actinomycetota bacterium]